MHPKLLPILRDSQIFARLEMQILHGFRTKYGMALYEIIAKRIGLKHVFYNDFETDELTVASDTETAIANVVAEEPTGISC